MGRFFWIVFAGIAILFWIALYLVALINTLRDFRDKSTAGVKLTRKDLQIAVFFALLHIAIIVLLIRMFIFDHSPLYQKIFVTLIMGLTYSPTFIALIGVFRDFLKQKKNL